MAPISYVVVLLMASLFQLFSTHPLDEESELGGRPLISGAPCTSGPLGMESRAIPDSSITASSTYSSSYPPSSARLNIGSNGWIPRPPQDQWIQVDLGEDRAITGLTVQGDSSGRYYVTSFSVQFSDTGESANRQNLSNLEGETIEFSVSSGAPQNVPFPTVLVARFLRILPLTWTHTSYRLRFEVFGCRAHSVVRLVDGDEVRSGRVEIFHDDTWGAVCDNDWDMKEATVVCRQLGFLEALEAKTGSFFGKSEQPIVMDRVACKGTESGLADCPFVCSVSPGCNSSREAGVVCKPNIIRLVGGSNRTNGRVEIYKDYTWGTICDNEWDLTDATVACRQLGFAGAEAAKSGAYFGQGEGPVHLDGVTCAGSESKITDCPSFCWEEIKCNHTQDAGVVCRNGKVSSLGQADAV